MPDFTLYEQRLTALLQKCQAKTVDAIVVPASDEHLNEYLPEAWKRRDWLCGFTGSAGELLLLNPATVPVEKPCQLFVDSRYYEQAALEIPTSLVGVSKVGLEGHPTLAEALEQAVKLKTGGTAGVKFTIGVDFNTISSAKFTQFEDRLDKLPNPIEWLDTGRNPHWLDELKQAAALHEALFPALQPVFSLPDELTGCSLSEKLSKLRQALVANNVGILPITKLDEVAWTFNLRGADVAYNPVFIAYGLVTLEQAFLFTDAARLPLGVQQSLAKAGVQILPYTHFFKTIETFLTSPAESEEAITTWFDCSAHTAKLSKWITGCGTPILKKKSIIESLKAVKSSAELYGMRQANLQASVAITETLAWLWHRGETQQVTTEKQVADFLEGQYLASGASGLSFNTIAGAGANAAIVHYGTPSAEKLLDLGDWFLLDSGGQYPTLAGTTDCTRTTVFAGKASSKMKQVYTAVLQGHIACAGLTFPKGTTGATIDAVCRQPLWQLRLDYGHGTGHGVGAFLNVHEGPIGISKGYSVPFEVGNITSIEPGYYEAGWGGVRLENLYEVVERPQVGKDANRWLGFESLLYIPFERALIDETVLTASELAWLQAYTRAIEEKLLPLLKTDLAKAWVQNQRF
ncbi:MAG: M24 family metallopeptidase [Vampirovibrio sp.]|nr:M24 family metallopeptidase [Vampirovibrio sp.]